MTRPAHWTDSALCAQTDPELFYPKQGDHSGTGRTVCYSCPVRVRCLDEAMEIEEGSRHGRYGIWGGLTPSEREALAARGAAA